MASYASAHPEPHSVQLWDFQLMKRLADGGFSTVYAVKRATGTSKASQEASVHTSLSVLKVVGKRDVTSQEGCLTQLLRERIVLTKASNYPDYFVQLRSAFQTPTDLLLELEYMSGGDCLSLLTSSPGGLPESVAVGIVSQVCIALQHLHIHGVIHRDVKINNVMITARGHVKLGDMGSVCPASPDTLAQEFCSNRDRATPSSNFSTYVAAVPSLTPSGDAALVAGAGAVAVADAGGATGATGAPQVDYDVPQESNFDAYEPRVVITNPTLASIPQGVTSGEHPQVSYALPHLLSDCWLTITPNGSANGEDGARPGAQDNSESSGGSGGSSRSLSNSRGTSVKTPSTSGSDQSSGSLVFARSPGGSVVGAVGRAALAAAVATAGVSTVRDSGVVGVSGVLRGLTQLVGNVYYLSPEIACGSGRYTRACDWWGVGVLLFHLLTGTTPFEGADRLTTLENIENYNMCNWHKLPSPPQMSASVLELLLRLLERDPETRLGSLTGIAVLQHPGLAELTSSPDLFQHEHGPCYPLLSAHARLDLGQEEEEDLTPEFGDQKEGLHERFNPFLNQQQKDKVEFPYIEDFDYSI